MIDEQKLTAIRKRSQTVAVLSLVAFFILIGYSTYKLVRIRQDIARLEAIRDNRQSEVQKLEEQISDLQKQKGLFEQEAKRSTESLKTVIEAAPQAQVIPPRVYLQINDDSQREKANQVAELLQKQKFIVPGIENVGRTKSITTGKTDVRYYANNPDSASDIAKIKEALRRVGITPNEIKLPESSSGKARPRHYELWFGKDF